MDVAQMIESGVTEGDGVFTLGFPLGLVHDQLIHAIARLGIIARIRDLLNGHAKQYIIDASIFPGNSGGPVLIRPEVSAIEGTKTTNHSCLIGIVKSYVPYSDVAVSQQTGLVRVVFQENSGLALVETVDSIKETVELCFDTKVRPAMEGLPLPGEPPTTSIEDPAV